MFELDERLATSSFDIVNFGLCNVRLKNNKNYPWIILIPRVANVSEIFELSDLQQMQLMSEMSHVAQIMKHYFLADKINIGALGNIVSQLHIHVIARFKNDVLWPHSLWQENLKETPYPASVSDELISKLRVALL